MHLQKIHAKLTPIAVYEVPEYIIVETQFITQQYAKENNIEEVAQINKMQAGTLPLPKSSEEENLALPPPAETPDTINSSFTSRLMMVSDNVMPCRGREIQTDTKITADVGVQCDRVSEEWDSWISTQPLALPNANQNKGKFLSYVSRFTSMFPNGMMECLVCGEVTRYLQDHQSHMSRHFGPRALCYRCGTILEHQDFLLEHNYKCPSRPITRSYSNIYLKCPLPECNRILKSKWQLSRHIKKHPAVKSYYCVLCLRGFSSLKQFRLHRLVKAACSKAKHITSCAPKHTYIQLYVKKFRFCMVK